MGTRPSQYTVATLHPLVRNMKAVTVQVAC